MKLVSDKSKVSSRDHCRSDPVRVQSTQRGVLESLNKINCNKDALVCFSVCLLACLRAPWRYISDALMRRSLTRCWAEAPVKIARMTLTIKLDRNWSSFQLANSAPPLSVTDSAIAPSARMPPSRRGRKVESTSAKDAPFRKNAPPRRPVRQPQDDNMTPATRSA